MFGGRPKTSSEEGFRQIEDIIVRAQDIIAIDAATGDTKKSEE
jgi:major membrane immunogen (membrane-anchored lipoprotein)